MGRHNPALVNKMVDHLDVKAVAFIIYEIHEETCDGSTLPDQSPPSGAISC